MKAYYQLCQRGEAGSNNPFYDFLAKGMLGGSLAFSKIRSTVHLINHLRVDKVIVPLVRVTSPTDNSLAFIIKIIVDGNCQLLKFKGERDKKEQKFIFTHNNDLSEQWWGPFPLELTKKKHLEYRLRLINGEEPEHPFKLDRKIKLFGT